MANSYIVCSRSIDPLSKIIWQFIGIKSFKLDIVYTGTHIPTHKHTHIQIHTQANTHTNTHINKKTHA